jgi:hypothetical protein
VLTSLTPVDVATIVSPKDFVGQLDGIQPRRWLDG